MRHPSKSPLMRDIRMGWDSDQWGTVMQWWFAIADVLYHHAPHGTIPDAWEYRHSPVCDQVDRGEYPDCDVWLMLVCDDVTVADLVYAGNVLGRFGQWLKLAGQDY